MIDDTRGSDMEDACGAGDSGGNGVIVKQIDLEEAKAGISSFNGFQVLRFCLVP